MSATDKHAEAAREIVQRIATVHVWKGDCIADIAAALATAEREGMKRAAEIAREHIFSASQRGLVDDEFNGRNRRAEEIVEAILSETEGG